MTNLGQHNGLVLKSTTERVPFLSHFWLTRSSIIIINIIHAFFSVFSYQQRHLSQHIVCQISICAWSITTLAWPYKSTLNLLTFKSHTYQDSQFTKWLCSIFCFSFGWFDGFTLPDESYFNFLWTHSSQTQVKIWQMLLEFSFVR